MPQIWIFLLLISSCSSNQYEWFSPNKLNMQSNPKNSSVEISHQVSLSGGVFWFGSQLEVKGKLMPSKAKDGASPRKKVTVKKFLLDEHSVTNAQFTDFVLSTKYITDAELYGWSFVLDSQVSNAVRQSVDGPKGMGRVKDANHWMGVYNASWKRPYGFDSDIVTILDLPAIHISHRDAEEYCFWRGGRLPTEREWEFAARAGRVNESYPWGDQYMEGMMNIWDGDNFPHENMLTDGYHGLAPAKSFAPNEYGLYNMLGNCWEWVKGGDPKHRILRGGSFLDSKDGKFNHAVYVSTRHINSEDAGASNIGFRCATNYKPLRLEKTDRENLSAISKDSQVPNSQRSIKSKTQKKLLPHSKIVRLENELVRKVVEMKTKEEIILKRKGLYNITEAILREEMATSKKDCRELLNSVTALKRSLSEIESVSVTNEV